MIAVTRGVQAMRGPVASLLLGAALFSTGACLGACLACEAAPSATVAPSSLSAAEGGPSAGSAGSAGSPGDPDPSSAGDLGASVSAVVEASLASDPSTPTAPPSQAAGSDESQAPALRYWQRGDEDSGRSGSAREAAAFANKEAEVKELFAAAGVRFPPSQVLFRVFKEESELEIWATDDRREPLRRIAIYKICAASGGPGPKTRTGDHQVPEGFYEVDFFKPRSDYYLALHVNYPNRRDRSQRSTGSAIMIHGRCASIGCLAMSDDRIQELWVIGRSLRSGRVQVHIFPQRAMDVLLQTTTRDGLKGFWRSLAEGKRRFDADPRLPKKISFDDDGNYVFD